MSEGQSSKPISVVVDRHVLPGKIEAFEQALKGIIEASRQFPGYLGTDVSFPDPKNSNHYRVIFRYQNLEQLKAWQHSPERKHWIEIIDALIESPTELQIITGLETWFAWPRAKTMVPPKRYKMAVVTWLAITPLLIVFNLLVGPYLQDLPLPARISVSTPIIVLIMTYLLMPFMVKLFGWWLYPKNRD